MLRDNSGKYVRVMWFQEGGVVNQRRGRWKKIDGMVATVQNGAKRGGKCGKWLCTPRPRGPPKVMK